MKLPLRLVVASHRKSNSRDAAAPAERQIPDPRAPDRGRDRAPDEGGRQVTAGVTVTATMILVAYRHGLRVSELVDLRWDQVDFDHATLHVRRVKKGTPARIQSSATKCGRCAGSSASRIPSRLSYSQRTRLRRSPQRALPGLSSALVRRRGSASRFTRTCCATPAGYALANAGHDTRALQAYLGHKNIQHTVRYTELAPGRFKNFWR